MCSYNIGCYSCQNIFTVDVIKIQQMPEHICAPCRVSQYHSLAGERLFNNIIPMMGIQPPPFWDDTLIALLITDSALLVDNWHITSSQILLYKTWNTKIRSRPVLSLSAPTRRRRGKFLTSHPGESLYLIAHLTIYSNTAELKIGEEFRWWQRRSLSASLSPQGLARSRLIVHFYC